MNFFKRLFRNDKVLFALSILMAVALWMVVIADRNPETVSSVQDVPITLTGTEAMDKEELEFIHKSIETADVRFSGRLSEIKNVKESDVTISADLSDVVKPGSYEIPLSASIRQANVYVDRMDPASITIKVDYYAANRIVIEPQFKGNLPKGYVQGDYTLEPQSVSIDGPQDVVDEIDRVTVDINLNGSTRTITGEYAVHLLREDGSRINDSNIHLSSTSIYVTVPIYQEKEVPVEIATQGEFPKDTKVDMKVIPQTVTIRGNREDIAGITAIKTEPLRITKNIKTNKYTLNLDLPENVSCDLSEVDVDVTVKTQGKNTNN